MGSRAYRDALTATTASPRWTSRGRRTVHLFAIAAAAALSALALLHRITPPRVLFLASVATYAAGFGYGVVGVSRGRTAAAVPLVAAAIAFLLSAACWDTDHPLWWFATCVSMSAAIVVGFPSALIGWTVGAPLRRVRAVEPIVAPIARRVVPRRVSSPLVAEDAPAPQRDEPALDSLPDSTRPLIFAVRLRRRMFERTRSAR